MANTYTQEDRTYTLKPNWLEVEHYYGLLQRKLAILQTESLGDANLDKLEKYEKDIEKFELNKIQIEEACEAMQQQASKEKDSKKSKEILKKVPELKTKRNYANLIKNYEACKNDLSKDRKAQRQLDLRKRLFMDAYVELLKDEELVMECLQNILNGDTDKLIYDIVFTLAVVNDFFIYAKESNPLLKKYADSMSLS